MRLAVLVRSTAVLFETLIEILQFRGHRSNLPRKVSKINGVKRCFAGRGYESRDVRIQCLLDVAEGCRLVFYIETALSYFEGSSTNVHVSRETQ